MKRIIDFIKTTAIGGLLVIIPLTVVLFVLAQLFLGLYEISTAVLESFPIGTNDAVTIFLLTALSLVGLCFLTGLAVQTRLGMALRDWFARKVAPRIPMYGALSNLTKRFVGVDGSEFSPVEVDLYGSDVMTLAFLVENLPDERCAVFVPMSPVTTIGNIFIVPASRVHSIDASIGDAVSVITQWGVDAKTLYEKK